MAQPQRYDQEPQRDGIEKDPKPLRRHFKSRLRAGQELSGFLERLPARRSDESSQRLVGLRQQVTQQTGVGEEGVRGFTLRTANWGSRLETIDELLQRFCALR
jgi:hypothetical protein